MTSGVAWLTRWLRPQNEESGLVVGCCAREVFSAELTSSQRVVTLAVAPVMEKVKSDGFLSALSLAQGEGEEVNAMRGACLPVSWFRPNR